MTLLKSQWHVLIMFIILGGISYDSYRQRRQYELQLAGYEKRIAALKADTTRLQIECTQTQLEELVRLLACMKKIIRR